MSLLVCLFIHHFFCRNLSCSIGMELVPFRQRRKKVELLVTVILPALCSKPVSKSWQWRKRWSKGWLGLKRTFRELMSRDYFPSRTAICQLHCTHKHEYVCMYVCKAGNGSSCCTRSFVHSDSDRAINTGDENKEAKFIEIYVCILFLLLLLFCSRFGFSRSSLVDSRPRVFWTYRICATYLYTTCACVCERACIFLLSRSDLK